MCSLLLYKLLGMLVMLSRSYMYHLFGILIRIVKNGPLIINKVNKRSKKKISVYGVDIIKNDQTTNYSIPLRLITTIFLP